MRRNGAAMGKGKTLVLRIDLEERYLHQLREAFPDLNLVTAKEDEEFERVLEQADAIVGGNPLSQEQLARAQRLRWVQVTSAGVEEWLSPALAKHQLVLANFSGIAAPNIADHVLALLFAFARGLPELLDRQRRKEWGDAAPATFEPAGQTLGIVGLGDIGEALAEKAAGLKMRVLAVQRHQSAPPF